MLVQSILGVLMRPYIRNHFSCPRRKLGTVLASYHHVHFRTGCNLQLACRPRQPRRQRLPFSSCERLHQCKRRDSCASTCLPLEPATDAGFGPARLRENFARATLARQLSLAQAACIWRMRVHFGISAAAHPTEATPSATSSASVSASLS